MTMTHTDSYLLSRAKLFGDGASVLDLGCGDGRFVEILKDAGFKPYGVDIADARPDLESRFLQRPDLRDCIILIEDGERIPLSDKSVDVILSNTVFEHIPKLEVTVREMARVLKPTGAVYATFPLKSCIMEQHINLPLFHRIKSKRVRLAYAKVANALGLYRSNADPDYMEYFVARYCHYRSKKEAEAIFRENFSSVESDTRDYAGLKRQWLKPFAPMIHRYHTAAYKLASPKAA